MGLDILAQASMPLRYWVKAFFIDTYLINRLPTPVLENKSSFEKAYNKKPNYNLLKTFGSACFPCLRPYQSYKFQFHSTKCALLYIVTRTKGTNVFKWENVHL